MKFLPYPFYFSFVMARKQYKSAKEMTLSERLLLVMKLVNQKMSAREIAGELQYTIAQAKNDIAAIEGQSSDIENVEEYLGDIKTRTIEQLESLKRQEAILWKQLDWANEWVVQTDSFGSAKFELDEKGKKTNTPVMGFRNPSAVRQLISQIQACQKQQADLLGLMSKNSDVTIKLQQTEQIQIIILDNLREADPIIYGKIRRQLVALKAAQSRPDLPEVGIGRSLDDVLEGEYKIRG